MRDPLNEQGTAGPDDKTTVLPETAVALVEMERLQQELLASEERAKNHWEQYLRALADVENVRKRAAKDLESTRQFAVEKFAQDLIAVKDSLELGIANSEGGAASPMSRAWSKGRTPRCACWPRLSRRRRSKRSTLKAPQFNPELHEAMMAQPSDAPPNTVLSVVQRGYQLNGRLLRPARVIVSAPRAETSFLETRDPASRKGPRVNTQ